MSDDNTPSTGPSRREAMKTALKVGAYATPVILSAAVPAPVAAQVTGPTGTLTGTIRSASSSLPIAGATVTVATVSATTNASGVYTISNAPSGVRSVTTSAPGYITRTDSVNITPGGSTSFSTALVLASAGGNLTIVLTWGAVPNDLDSHLVGPSGGTRFHCYYGSPTPVSYASLDIDDTSAFGPETITVSTVSGVFVAGSYSYFVVNFSGSPEFDASSAIVTVFQGGAQIAQFLASAATGSPTLDIWSVFSFTLTATASGQIAITPVQQFTSTAPTLTGFVRTPKT